MLIARSATGWMVSVSVSLLLAAVGSVTPTGAAILTTLAASAGRMPALTVDAIGYGAGTMDLPDTPGELINGAQVTVVDGPAFGDGGAGSFRLNFATPQPILTEMVERVAAALNSAQATGLSGPA